MEYFLPLAVMTMIISCLSMFLIDYQQPASSTDPNNQTPSNPSDLTDSSAEEILVSEKNDNIDDHSFSGEVLSEKNSTNILQSRGPLLAF